MVDGIDRIGKKHPTRLYIREWMALEQPTLTQDRLAERMECSPGTVSKLLRGEMEMTTSWLANFADALDRSVPDLFRDPARPTRDDLLRGYSNEELTSALQLIDHTRGVANRAAAGVVPITGESRATPERPTKRAGASRGK